MDRTTLISLLAIVALGIGGALLVRIDEQSALAQSLTQYRTESAATTRATADGVEQVFRNVHQGLRTIARLPGVRNIDRYARGFDSDARQTVQEKIGRAHV